jgi:hypothetical protein
MKNACKNILINEVIEYGNYVYKVNNDSFFLPINTCRIFLSDEVIDHVLKDTIKKYIDHDYCRAEYLEKCAYAIFRALKKEKK